MLSQRATLMGCQAVSCMRSQMSRSALRCFLHPKSRELLGKMRYSIAKLAARSTYGRKIDTHRRVTPVFRKALDFGEKIAIRDAKGEYSYVGLLEASVKLAEMILKKLNGNLQERVAFITKHDATFVIMQWACWISGQIAVPLDHRQSSSMVEYYLSDSDTTLLVTIPEFEERMKNVAVKVGCKLYVVEDCIRCKALKKSSEPTKIQSGKTPASYKSMVDVNKPPQEGKVDLNAALENFGIDRSFYNDNDGLIVYSSAAFGPPKGVVLSHVNIEAQAKCLINTWEFQSRDCILHVLPLNHLHGVINAMHCPLSVGARVVMRDFDTSIIWTELMGVHKAAVDRVNVFMGVPQMYSRLIQEYEESLRKSERMMDYIKSTCSQKIRLFICGSAALPKSTFDRWEQITGHQLLERYGTTETGVVLSNPLHGSRQHGTVGLPVIGVHVRIVSDTDGSIIAEGSNMGTRVLGLTNPPVGFLYARGDSVFKQYWRKPNATSRDFTMDGWFKTGDIAKYSKGRYTVLGRYGIDIIKTGAFKVSALQVESALLDNENIKDVTVLGIPDPTWGQQVAAIVSLKPKKTLTQESLKTWALDRLPQYAIPTVLKIVKDVPRDMMGKVDKFRLIKTVFPDIKPPEFEDLDKGPASALYAES